MILTAVDDRDGTLVPRFAWSLVGEVPGVSASGEAVGGSTWLTIPLDVPAAVRVHAARHASSLAVDVSLCDGATNRAVTVRLLPAFTGPAVVLKVVDDQQRAVPRVRIRTEVQPAGEDARNRWDLLGERQSTALDGRHALSDLEPARYRLRVLALDGAGRPRMLLPGTQQVRFDGQACAEASLALLPGGSIELIVRDAAGASLGPGLTVQLVAGDGRPCAARWRPAGPAATAARAGTLPVAGPCELDEPVPPGDYSLQVSGPSIDERRQVRVLSGQRTRVELSSRR